MKSIHQYLRGIALEAAHKGLTRTLEQFFEKENLPAKDWPPYVKKEIIEKIPLKLREHYEATHTVEETLQRLKSPEGLKTFDQFKLHFDPQPKTLKLKTDLSYFTPGSKKDLSMRIKTPEGYEIRGIPRDIERREKQKELMRKQEINDEPVILIKRGNAYEIREGWHRIMALVELAQEKNSPLFNLKSYVGEERPIKDLITKFETFLKKSF